MSILPATVGWQHTIHHGGAATNNSPTARIFSRYTTAAVLWACDSNAAVNSRWRKGGFLRRDAAGKPRRRPAMHQLVEKRRPHLQNGVAKANLEDRPRDDLEGRFVAHVDVPPDLLAAGVVEQLEPLGILRRKSRRAARAQHLEIPRVLLAGGDPLRFQRHGKDLARGGIHGVAQQRGVVPRIAGGHLPAAIGPLRDDVREHGPHGSRNPTGAERDVAGVQPQIAHAAVLAVECGDTLPVQRLLWIEVAGVQKSRIHFQDSPKRLLLD